MANEEHFAIFKQGIAAWNIWRREYPEIQPDLSYKPLHGMHPRDISWANLSSTNLCGCNLRYADCIETNLNGANLSEAWLFDCDLSHATMRDANLIGADLTLATLFEADLSGANLSGAILDETSFKKAILHRTIFTSATMKSKPDFTEASVAWTIFTNVNLGGVKGLETVSHLGPSSIGIDTIYRSQGKIPEIFLRNAGMPAPFLELMRSLTLPAEYTTCVISYAEADEAFAQQFYADLLHNGVRCWLSCKKRKLNDNQEHSVDTSLYLYDTLLLVLSQHSVKSDWIEHEIRSTGMKEQYEEKPTALFLITLDQSSSEATSSFKNHLRRDQKEIQDFTQWESDTEYQKALMRLLVDLSAKASPPVSRDEEEENFWVQ